jgi:uncharacterized protein (DUF1015 family)
MSNIKPFRAFRYQLPKRTIERAVCPPYDTIDDALAQKLRKTSFNAIHIELPEGTAEKKYENAKKILESWEKQGVVQQDPKAAFYIYQQSFEVNGRLFHRKGFFCELALEKPGSGSVLRHELTLAGPKQDRLKLLQALRLNTSPIFGLFPDSKKKVKNLLNRITQQTPEIHFKDKNNVRHQLWSCNAPKDIALIQKTVQAGPVAIADGHHRYETAWNFRQECKEPKAKSTLFYLSPMADPGLVVFPTHRIVKRMNGMLRVSLQEVLKQVGLKKDLFKMRPLSTLKVPKRSSFIITNGKKSYAIALKDPKLTQTLFPGKPKAYQDLALVWIHSLLVPEMKKEDFLYSHDLQETLHLMKKNKSFAILVPPTSIQELYRIVRAGMLMPQKSTYFYPKVLTGLVFRSLY